MLFLLFLLYLYQFNKMGVMGLTAICILPAVTIFVFLALKHQNALFWYVFFMNYFVMGLQRYGYIPLQVTIVTVLPQVLLIIALIIHPRKSKNSLGTPMLFAILLWTTYLIIQVFNETCGLPLSIPNWLTNLNFFSFYFILAHILISKIINTPENIMRFIRLWAIFSLVATYWAWRQKTFGWDQTTAHFCVLPAQDRVRVWVGSDPDRYVDRAYSRDSFDLAHALEDWFKQHGRIAEEDWREKYPERSRKMYLEHITGQGYSDKEAEEIMHYLPLTISDQISDNVTTMIELWKSKAKVVTPFRAPLWKKKCSGNKEY